MNKFEKNNNKQPLDPESVFLYIPDLKKRYGIGNDAVYSLVRKKAFPSTKIGNRFCVRMDFLLKYEEDCSKKCIAIV